MSELNFEVIQSPIYYRGADGTMFDNIKYKGLVRDDNDELLSVKRNTYNPLFIKDFKDITQKIQKASGFEFEQYQEFDGGRVILSYLKNNQSLKEIAGFEMNNYMVIGSSFNGKTSTFCGSNSTMIRCMNAFSRISRTNRIRHTMSADIKIEELINSIEDYFIITNNMYQDFEVWNNKKIYADTVEYAIRTIVELEEGEENSTRKINNALRLKECMQIETNAIGDNLFGLFNGFTRFSSHHLNPKSSSYGAIVGNNKAFNDKAFNLVKELELVL